MAPVNLHSDTQTRPSAGMRAAIAAAEVGDEQRGADPTTRELERRVAELLGQEAAVFMPSGVGVREYVLLTLLPPELAGGVVGSPEPVAALAVLLLRLVWTVAELGLAGIIYWLPGPSLQAGGEC